VISKDKDHAFADLKLGYDFVSGCDPTAGFDKQTVHTISLKIKI